jgi:hypothetical protein
LYRRNEHEFSSATPKPLGDLAWDYFFGLPVSKTLHRDPKKRDSLNHVQAVLIKRLEDNYAWMGQHWPDSPLSGDQPLLRRSGEREARPVDRGLALRL